MRTEHTVSEVSSEEREIAIIEIYRDQRRREDELLKALRAKEEEQRALLEKYKKYRAIVEYMSFKIGVSFHTSESCGVYITGSADKIAPLEKLFNMNVEEEC